MCSLVSPNYIEMKRKIASLQITSNHVSNHLLLSVKSVPTSTHHGRGKCNSKSHAHQKSKKHYQNSSHQLCMHYKNGLLHTKKNEVIYSENYIKTQ